jgi:AmmeMemoRadiSam system protein A
MCGWTAVLTLLYITENESDIQYQPLLYKNSGDTAIFGDKHRVVGYQSVAVLKKNAMDEKFLILTNNESQLLLQIAHNAITDMLDNKYNDLPDGNLLSENLKQLCGVFVSVYVKNELRGCIGRLETTTQLYISVHDMAKAAAMHDTRFKPVSKEEIDSLSIEISVLTPLKKISSVNEIIPGRHGILIKKDNRSGTFLPQVAQRTGWTTEEMLQQCSERKAGLGPDGWKHAEIYIYEVLIISDKPEN